MRVTPAFFLAALASLSVGGCKSDDSAASQTPAQPGPAASPAPEAAAGGEEQPNLDGRMGGGQVDPKVAERRAEMRRKFDANGDGKLSRDERQTMQREMLNQRVSRIDADGDGKLSLKEAESAPFGRRLLADGADANQDSIITRDEIEAVVAERQQRRREMRRQQKGAEGAPAATEDPGSPF